MMVSQGEGGFALVLAEVDSSPLLVAWALLGLPCGIPVFPLRVAPSGVRGQNHSPGPLTKLTQGPSIEKRGRTFS